MKLFLRSVTIIIFLLAVDLIFYGCPKTKDFRYRYSGADITIYNSDTLYPRTVVENAEVHAKDLVFKVRLPSELIAKNYIAPTLFSNSAYAFQFHDNYYNITPLKSIKFTSLNTYNSEYGQGDDITAAMLFGIYDPDMLYDSSNGKSFIKYYNDYTYYTEGNGQSPVGEFHLKFIKLPTQNTPQQFALAVELTDGTIFRDTTVRFIAK